MDIEDYVISLIGSSLEERQELFTLIETLGEPICQHTSLYEVEPIAAYFLFDEDGDWVVAEYTEPEEHDIVITIQEFFKLYKKVIINQLGV